MLMSLRLGKHVTRRQKRWLESIEKRINFTSEILGSIKNVKMLGLTEMMESLIKALREQEIVAMKASRKLGCVNTCIGEY